MLKNEYSEILIKAWLESNRYEHEIEENLEWRKFNTEIGGTEIQYQVGKKCYIEEH